MTKSERPILYKASMVRATLDGLKTQTRRLRGFEKINECPDDWRPFADGFEYGQFCISFGNIHTNEIVTIKSPYGWFRDFLWVRENFRLTHSYNDSPPSLAALHGNSIVCYEATEDHKQFGNLFGKIRPSIHMPRALSRISLQITDLRVERLQSISEKDALAEGMKVCPNMNDRKDVNGYVFPDSDYDKAGLCHSSAAKAFIHGFAEINGREIVEKNPWLWAIHFGWVE